MMILKKKGLAYAISASVLWAIVNPVIKVGLESGITPINFAGIRFTGVGVVLLIYTFNKKSINKLLVNKRLFLLLIFVNIFLGYSAFYIGVSIVEGAISSIIMGMTPLINVILSHFFTKNDKLNKHKIISILISCCGLFVLTTKKIGVTSSNEIEIVGIGLLLLNILLQGYCGIKVAEYKEKINPVFLNGVQMFFGGILLYGVGVWLEGYQSILNKTPKFYTSLGILIFISIFAFNFWFKALQERDSSISEVNMCRLINPILGAIISWIILPDEYPTLKVVVGMLIIMYSLIYYFKKTK